jgi:hypothetical protein
MWLIFNESGEFVYSINIEPNPLDVVGKTVIESDITIDLMTKRYFLVNGNIVTEDFVTPEPPPIEPPTIVEKLASAGISIEELKEALGLK